MKIHKDFVQESVIAIGSFVLYLIIVIGMIYGYGANIYYLCKADFEPTYKEEIIRSIGVVVPPFGVIVGYIDMNDSKDGHQ